MIRPDGGIVILTGAGVSAESGISTFRDADGLWARYRIEDVATPQAFRRNPDLVRTFYNERRAQLVAGEVEPNRAHFALAELESEWRGPVTLVTQNVDNLHERAGSRNVIHMHGELLKIRCQKTNQVLEYRGEVAADMKCPCCGETGTLRPHVVWFGEMPLHMDRVTSELQACDLLIAVGTSGQVYPAAGFADLAKRQGALTVELNLDPTDLSNQFDEVVHGPATEVVPEFAKRLLGKELRS